MIYLHLIQIKKNLTIQITMEKKDNSQIMSKNIIKKGNIKGIKKKKVKPIVEKKTKKKHGEFPPKKKGIEIEKNDKSDLTSQKESRNVKDKLSTNKTSLIDSHHTFRLINSKHDDIKENNLIKDNNEQNIENTGEKILSDFELNNLEYYIALQDDKRYFFRVYWSILKREHIIIFTFFSWITIFSGLNYLNYSSLFALIWL